MHKMSSYGPFCLRRQRGEQTDRNKLPVTKFKTFLTPGVVTIVDDWLSLVLAYKFHLTADKRCTCSEAHVHWSDDSRLRTAPWGARETT